jgi:single-strand DNA-binding protein
MFNRVIMGGNLVADPELRYTTSGTAVSNMRIAVGSKYKSGEEWKEETLFIGVVIWGKQAESCAQYLDKGRQVLVEGRLQERSWESDGQTRKKMEIVASTVKFIGGKGEQSSGPAPDEISDIEPF